MIGNDINIIINALRQIILSVWKLLTVLRISLKFFSSFYTIHSVINTLINILFKSEKIHYSKNTTNNIIV